MDWAIERFCSPLVPPATLLYFHVPCSFATPKLPKSPVFYAEPAVHHVV